MSTKVSQPTSTVFRDQLTSLYLHSVNSKAQVRFHIDSADWIPTRVKDRLKSMVHHHITSINQLGQGLCQCSSKVE